MFQCPFLSYGNLITSLFFFLSSSFPLFFLLFVTLCRKVTGGKHRKHSIITDDMVKGFFLSCFLPLHRTMDLSLRDALGGGGGGVPGGNPADALLKRDFVGALEKDSYDDKVGETISKSDYRPLLDGKDSKSGEWPPASDSQT